MTEPIEHSTEHPAVSLPEYSSYEVNQSIDPSLSTPVSNSSSPASSSSGDSFSTSGPLHLTTLVSVRNPQQFGGRSSLTLENLLLEAANNPAAQDEIIQLVQSRSGDSRVTGMCYASSDDVLGNILAQLISTDPVAQREGRLSLEHYILGDSSDPAKALQLRLGALATVARISQTHPQNAEARQLLVSVYRQTPHQSPLGQGMDQLSNRAVILQAVGQTQVAARAESMGGGTTLPASAASALGVAGTFGGGATALAYAVLPDINPAQANFSQNQANQITQTVERILGGTHLESIPSEEIVAAAQRYLSPAIDQFRQDLRRGILGLGMRYTEFSGSHFPAHVNLANKITESVSAIVFSGASQRLAAAGRADLVADAAPGLAQRGIEARVIPTAAPVGGSAPTIDPTAPTELAASFPATGNPHTQSLAGMQGALSQGGALAYVPSGNISFGASSGLGYVEGPTPDEGAHDGFSGDSSGNQQGHSNPDQQDQPQPQPDSYIA